MKHDVGALPSATFGGWAASMCAASALIPICIMLSRAQRLATHSWWRQSAFHHHKLLPARAKANPLIEHRDEWGTRPRRSAKALDMPGKLSPKGQSLA